MGFYRVWLLGFLVALVLPVLIHLFWRRRVAGRRFPMAWLLPQTELQRKRFRTLRYPLLLGIRLLIYTLLILAFALPVPLQFQGREERGRFMHSSGEQYVFVVDASPSMYSGRSPTAADQTLALLEQIVVQHPVAVQTCAGRFWVWSPQQLYALLGEPGWRPCRLYELLLGVEDDEYPVVLSDFQSAFLAGMTVSRPQVWVVPQGERSNVFSLQVLQMDWMQAARGDSLVVQVAVTCPQCPVEGYEGEVRLKVQRQVMARQKFPPGSGYMLLTLGAVLQGVELTGVVEGWGGVADPYPLDNVWYWSVVRRPKTHVVWAHVRRRAPVPNSLFDRVRRQFPEVEAITLTIHPLSEFLQAMRRVCPDVLWIEAWDRLSSDDQNALLIWLDTATVCAPLQSFFFVDEGESWDTGMVYLDLHAPVWRALLPVTREVRWVPVSASCPSCSELPSPSILSASQVVWTPVVHQTASQQTALWRTRVHQLGTETRTQHWIGIVPSGEGLALWRHPPVTALLLYALFLHGRWWVLTGVPGGVLPEIPGLPDSFTIVVQDGQPLRIRERRVPGVAPGFYTLHVQEGEGAQPHVLAVNLHPDERSPFLSADSLARRAEDWQAEIQPITGFREVVLGGSSFPDWYRWLLAGALLFLVVEMLYVGGWVRFSSSSSGVHRPLV